MYLLSLAQSCRSRNANKKRSETAKQFMRKACTSSATNVVKEPTPIPAAKVTIATKTTVTTKIESTIHRCYGFKNKPAKTIGSKPTMKVSSKTTSTKKKIHPAPKNSVNEGIVKKFIECINTQDVDVCMDMLKPPQHWRFSGEMNITMKQYGELIQKIIRSFPDFSIKYKEVVEVGPGVVQVRHAVESGTHTGEPFGFQCYQTLPATGLKCVNDPEHLTFFINDGKIVQVHVICTGSFCGPVGLYKQSKTVVDLHRHSFELRKNKKSVGTASAATCASCFATLRKSGSSRTMAAIAA